MHPAFSVILLTTLIGTGQGLFLLLYANEVAARAHLVAAPERGFAITSGVIALLFVAAGLIASFFHLGRPARAWRAAAAWRSSWLSREVIVLPLFMLSLLLWTLCHNAGAREEAAILGALSAVLALTLFLCTGMIYACLRMIQEWATPLTPINFLLLGCASGASLAAAAGTWLATPPAAFYRRTALLLILIGAATRIAALARNRALRPRSNLQTAIGIRHPKIVQRAQGAMGGSFNTREFFHGVTPARMRAIKWGFVVLAFALPGVLLAMGAHSVLLLSAAFVCQFLGLVAERWYFFAEANHPQNLYYQAIS